MSDWIKPTEHTGEIKDILTKCDCFVGGIDLTIGYMCAFWVFDKSLS